MIVAEGEGLGAGCTYVLTKYCSLAKQGEQLSLPRAGKTPKGAWGAQIYYLLYVIDLVLAIPCDFAMLITSTSIPTWSLATIR